MSGNALDAEGLLAVTARLVEFMRFFEQWQQDLDFRQPQAAQQGLRESHEALLAPLASPPADRAPGAASRSAHPALGDVIDLCSRTVARLLLAGGADFAPAFIESRRLWCEALALSYALRADVAPFAAYWSMAGRAVTAAAAAADDAGLGVTLHGASDAHGGYALYVPEDYTPAHPPPLVVCLHGAYGHGQEYLWTWMRVACSAGAMVLAPKSRGPTWSLLDPQIDIASVRAMLEALAARYRYDPQRVLLTGLSDGGSFAYCLGLSCPSLFSAVAPVAGVLHPVMDQLLRARQGLATPLCVVHGARDFIFDVRSVRSHCALLDKLGYPLTYIELPEWGHAYTDAINERLVWPWFTALAP